MRVKEKYDFSKLLGRIKEKGYTQEAIANAISRNSCTFSQKINNKGVFNATEIAAICGLLEIGATEIGEYFFTPKFRNSAFSQECRQFETEA